jgi:hypothetical protein
VKRTGVLLWVAPVRMGRVGARWGGVGRHLLWHPHLCIRRPFPTHSSRTAPLSFPTSSRAPLLPNGSPPTMTPLTTHGDTPYPLFPL